jgi:hypothetical protein
MELSKLTQKDPAASRPVDVELPSGLGTVKVRKLSRGETMRLMEMEVGQNGRVKLPLDVWERKLLAAAMIDPEMTEEDAREWQENGASDDIEKVTAVIQQLAGVRRSIEDATKS